MMATVYQQPDCPISPELLTIIEQRGYQTITIDIAIVPPTRAQLVALLVGLQMTPGEVLRKDVELYDTLALSDAARSDHDFLGILSLHPILIRSPILVTDKGMRLCPTEEQALEIL